MTLPWAGLFIPAFVFIVGNIIGAGGLLSLVAAFISLVVIKHLADGGT
jgi:hypothetical protein